MSRCSCRRRRLRIAFSFELTGSAEVRLRILKEGKWIATPFKGPLDPGVRRVEWDGAKRVGRLLDGTYEAVVEATDAITTSTVRGAVHGRHASADDQDRPAIPAQGLGERAGPTDAPVRHAQLGARGARRGGSARDECAEARHRAAVAWDAAGNTSIPASKR